MRAVVVREFGPPETIRVEEFPTPQPSVNDVLIDVYAAGVNFPDMLVMNIAVLGLQISDYRDHHPAAMRRAMAQLFDLYAQGKLKPWVGATYPLERFADAFAAIAARKAVGKLVLKVK